MALTSQERHCAISSVWNLSDEAFFTAGGVEFKQLVHAAVLLVRGQQTHIEEFGFRRHIFVARNGIGARVYSKMGHTTQGIIYSRSR